MNSDNTTIEFNSNKIIHNTTLNIILTTDEVDLRPIYLAGNFNNWATQDPNFVMKKVGDNKYQYSFPEGFELPETLLYKFTKGDWSAVEIGVDEEITPNRTTNLKSGVQNEFVPKWRKNWLPFKPNFLPQVVLLSDEFEIPQLNTTRKVWALLPHDYDATEEHYPVLYLQDAQNLFHENSKYGNWEIDKKLAVMSEYKIGKIIIVAVEHAEEDRIKEYNVGKTILGKGQGKKYIKFLTETLKPYVDKNFRTKTDRTNTGIGGSSMGGLISIFSGLRNPEIFGKLMIFSPSLWVVPQLKIDVDVANTDGTKIYLYAGGEESDNTLEHVKRFKERLINSEFVKDKMRINLSINKEGQHNETYWSDEFPKAIEWLFFNSNN
ncbi:alpha/beta hydrolase-fold protein [Flavobacterium sp. NG2]|uniref:alpha/beta hydrolase n=1 Tax=Flavobacterium sp. NG2 TaxID=3097547 RepID=UPI002A823CC6|nr:alpha/beta hydrolase-fold protein [Flavobacterium sp. NG2]WPR70778.1 alpha/beta hydrolase-fold protein [Flavobacterium sp. NG2]